MERKKRKKGWLKWGLAAFALLFLITMVYHLSLIHISEPTRRS